MSTRSPDRSVRPTTVGVIALILIALGLSVPAPAYQAPPLPSGDHGFAWDSDSLWQVLETSFVAARQSGCSDTLGLARDLSELRVGITRLRGSRLNATAVELDAAESALFGLAPRIAACPERLDEYVALHSRLREVIKWQSQAWDVQAPDVRDRLYRALYGGRAAVEEVMLQNPDRIVPLLLSDPVSSATPGASRQGVELRSGDIIVSRGGYPTSALIARGNDYPGNFSHIALVHVDEVTGDVSIIEAHIEVGVVIGTLDSYLADKKLRMMLLRPRPDLPSLVSDPMLPHRAASRMLQRARSEHIPYDFTMDYSDPTHLFCSEVASAAYRTAGLELWMGISTISSEGLRRWLGSFGVRHFETQEPSDLEYDPQLAVVAEWRDAESLFDDHIDNAVTDVMLEGAERGDDLGFPWYSLPVARLMKGYSWVLTGFGGAGPIPEGMSAAAALRNREYSSRHAALAERVRASATTWESERGYRPAYWTLIELARRAVTASGP